VSGAAPPLRANSSASVLASVAEPSGVAFVHTAYGVAPSEFTVSWYTAQEQNVSSVRYGTQRDALTDVAHGTAATWRAGEGWDHHVHLSALAANTTHYFRCGGGAAGWSRTLQFRTQPARAADTTTVALVADLGIEHSDATMSRLGAAAARADVDHTLLVGDMAYADDHVFSFHHTWLLFLSSLQPAMAAKPLMVAPGNHESHSWDPLLYEATKNFHVYNTRFRMPQQASRPRVAAPRYANHSMFYSYDSGPVHFLVYSTESSYKGCWTAEKEFGDQMAWLRADLQTANANRAQRPWIVAAGHRPMYSSSSHFSDASGHPIDCALAPIAPCNAKQIQTVFEDVFNEHHVDLIINGHIHAYERVLPTYRAALNTSAPHSVTIGNAGNIEGHEKLDYSPPWLAKKNNADFGYSMLTATRTKLSVTAHRATDDSLIDAFTIERAERGRARG